MKLCNHLAKSFQTKALSGTMLLAFLPNTAGKDTSGTNRTAATSTPYHPSKRSKAIEDVVDKMGDDAGQVAASLPKTREPTGK